MDSPLRISQIEKSLSYLISCLYHILIKIECTVIHEKGFCEYIDFVTPRVAIMM